MKKSEENSAVRFIYQDALLNLRPMKGLQFMERENEGTCAKHSFSYATGLCVGSWCNIEIKQTKLTKRYAFQPQR